MEFSAEEVNALKAVFSLFDEEGKGTIALCHLTSILEKIGRDPQEAEEMIKDHKSLKSDQELEKDEEEISFEVFLGLMKNRPHTTSGLCSGPDPKVLEFINILEEYRNKCEADGNYLEAERADGQLKALRKQEAKRQSKSLKARQIAERQDVQIAHNMQYTDFNTAWDQYLEEYDRMAQAYLKQMSEKHQVDLSEYQEKLRKEILDRPPKFSKELIEWRRRQHRLARQKNYTDAQKIKKVADEMEEQERDKMNEDYKVVFQRKEAQYRQQQQAELQALLKRVDGRRKEHIKQRNLDSKRLLQRNRNVQSVLESKQAVEAVKKKQDIKSSLIPKDRIIRNTNLIPSEARVIKPKKSARKNNQDIVTSSNTFITS